ncbi:hypothetical protein [Stygiolobus caldivivus]|uniref:Uncharacterized protein n=1 Tax=Stygiolobus caldivivus TaxID=2824673 RepID=A0A8D5ZEA3_9CREN|nr:hypothetical protein [Stygiolobus caldivivus]BCU69553.1 hypothetical protein KN1_08500 [Stygiolobus caldivivus]
MRVEDITRFLEILRFFIFSRFTKGFVFLTIAFSAIMLLFYLSIGKLLFISDLLDQLRVSVLEFVTFFLIFNIFSSIVQKADFDFLITAPMKTSYLVLLYLFGSIFTGGGYFLVLSAIMFFIYEPPFSYLAFLSFSLFGLGISSLTLAKNKVLLILFLALISWLPYFHVYYTPTSLIFGKIVYGSVTSVLLSLFLFYYSITRADLQMSGSKGRNNQRNLIDGKHSVVRYIFSTYEFVWGYGSTFSGRRLFFYVIPYYKAIALSGLLSLLYFALEVVLRPPFYTGVIAPNVLIVSFLSTTGLYALSQERPWLTFLSMDPGSLLAKKITIKSVQTTLLSIPFALVDVTIGKAAMGISLIGGVLLGYLLTTLLMSKLNPIQFRGEVYNYRAGSGMVFVIMADYFVIAMTVLLGLFLIASIVYLLISTLFLLFIFSSKKMWEKIGFNLVEKGFQ